MAVNAGCCGSGPTVDVEGGETPTSITHVTKDGRTYTVTNDVKVSADPDNALEIRDDGLYVAASYTDAIEIIDSPVSGGSVRPTDLAPDNNTAHVVSTASGEFVNPSSTRPFHAQITPQVSGLGVQVVDRQVDVWFACRAVVSGDVSRVVAASYRWNENRQGFPGSTHQAFQGLSRAYSLVIPPGGEVTVELQSVIRVYTYTGQAWITEWANRVSLVGGTR